MADTTVRDPGHRGGTDSSTCLVFFRASAGVAFQPCLCDSQKLSLQKYNVCNEMNDYKITKLTLKVNLNFCLVKMSLID